MSVDYTKLRNIQLETGDRTTIALEPEFWAMLKKISDLRHISLTLLVQEIDGARGNRSRAAALRLYVGDYFYRSAMEGDLGKFAYQHKLRDVNPIENGIFNQDND